MDIGLIGRKLGHSLSPQIHRFLGSYSYDLVELEENELDAFFEKRDFRGINVTIPYKLHAFRHCDEVSDAARRIGCVNTVVKRADGSLFGDNTDYFGFSYMSARAGADYKDRKVVILGSGGASMTARLVAADRGAREVVIVSRSGPDNYENIDRHYDADILINCTPVGMYPDNGKRIVDLKRFSRLEAVLDMIYNPYRTSLLLDAEALGIRFSNGLPMLVAQGAKSARYFRVPGDSAVKSTEEIIDRIRRDQLNVVICGMPGCGKTTLAHNLSKALDRPRIDTDEMIVKRAGKPIPRIFAEDGEKVFRDIESACVYDACKLSGAVISTGGGAVIGQANRDAMRSNGVVVLLERDVELLSTAGRPLSKDIDTLADMYKTRKPYYDAVADVRVKVCETPNETLTAVMKTLEVFFENSCN